VTADVFLTLPSFFANYARTAGLSLTLNNIIIIIIIIRIIGARGGVVVKALRYKPAGREFDWCHWNFSVT
jgi:ABC-type dipeptide/oligopeptide/nickel transport system permease subunit